jgi:hypothetical protein
MDHQTGQGTTRVYSKWWILFLAICFFGLQGLSKWLLTKWARRWRSLGTSIQTLFSAVHRATSPILHSGTWVIDSSIIETDGIIFHSVWRQKCNLLGKHGWFQFLPPSSKETKKKSLLTFKWQYFYLKIWTLKIVLLRKTLIHKYQGANRIRGD